MHRKIASALGVIALVSVTSIVGSAGPASSAECQFDGSIPGGSAKAYPVGKFYIDDRDFFDLDDDGTAGGIWVYEETNGQAGLQRGGSQWVYAKIPGKTPYIAPIYVLPPDENRPVLKKGYLFPDGFGGEDWATTLGGKDPCTESTNPDKIWF